MENLIHIISNRFTIRSLQVEDVTQEYLDWLHDKETSRFIISAKEEQSIEKLKMFVKEMLKRNDVLFFGIFDSLNRRHIGNIKFDPIDRNNRFAIMGILIGNKDYRGKGVAQEVLIATANWLKIHRQIEVMVLGVDYENIQAIRAYEKIGFKVVSSTFIKNGKNNILEMHWKL